MCVCAFPSLCEEEEEEEEVEEQEELGLPEDPKDGRAEEGTLPSADPTLEQHVWMEANARVQEMEMQRSEAAFAHARESTPTAVVQASPKALAQAVLSEGLGEGRSEGRATGDAYWETSGDSQTHDWARWGFDGIPKLNRFWSKHQSGLYRNSTVLNQELNANQILPSCS